MFVQWGSKGVERLVGQGTFDCPNCRVQGYKHFQICRQHHLYWGLIPLGSDPTEYEWVECERCGEKWEPIVLPERKAAMEKVQAESEALILAGKAKPCVACGVAVMGSYCPYCGAAQ